MQGMKTISTYLITALVVAGVATSVLAQDKKDEGKPEKKDELSAKVTEAKAALLKQDEGLKAHFDKAVGYVIFPSVAKGAVGVGGARGAGQLFEKGKLLGQATLSQVTIGFQLGGQAYSEVIFFEDQASLDSFKKSNMEFSAQVSAVAAKAGASKDAKYRKACWCSRWPKAA